MTAQDRNFYPIVSQSGLSKCMEDVLNICSIKFAEKNKQGFEVLLGTECPF